MQKPSMTALYSSKAAALWGTVIWQLNDGRVVECTAVDDPDKYNWPDKIILGTAAKFIRKGRAGSLEEVWPWQ